MHNARTGSADTAKVLEQVRNHFTNFAQVMRRRKLELAACHREVIKDLEAVEAGRFDRLMIFEPPRHGKSTLVSELFVPWYLGRHPDHSVICASYGAELAIGFGRRVRNSMLDPIYRAVFPNAVVTPDSTAAHRFGLTAGGAYFATGAGGVLTGRGCQLLILDDVLKGREEADSASFRKSLHEWYQSVAYSRLEPGGRVVIIQTRWHEDDLAGWLLKEHQQEGWRVISLPALAEPNDPLGRREGEALWPSRYPVKSLLRIKEAIGGAAWASLYQQRPAAAEGAIFKREWWRSYTAATLPARFEEIVVSADTAFKASSTSDYSVAVVLGVGPSGYYVLDVWRQRAEFPALKRALEMLEVKWRPDRVLIEDKASGQSLIQELKNSRLPVFPIHVDSDKVSRANAVTPLIEAGKVFLPEGASWLAEFIDELSSFPHAGHDDQVDALSQALNYARAQNREFPWMRELELAKLRARQQAGEVLTPAEAAELQNFDDDIAAGQAEGEALYAQYERDVRMFEEAANAPPQGPVLRDSYGRPYVKRAGM